MLYYGQIVKFTKDYTVGISKSYTNIIDQFKTKYETILEKKVNPSYLSHYDPNLHTIYFKIPSGTLGVLANYYVDHFRSSVRINLFNPSTGLVSPLMNVYHRNVSFTDQITPEEQALHKEARDMFVLKKISAREDNNLKVVEKMSNLENK